MRAKFAILLVSPIVLAITYSSISSLVFRPTSQTEMLSVPLQQIARTVKYHGSLLSEEDKSLINTVLPYDQLSERYNPKLSDPIKSSFDVETFNGDKSAYAQLWLELFLNHKKTYIAAFIYNTYGYIYPYFQSSTTTDILLNNTIHYNSKEGYTDDAYDSGWKRAVGEYRDIIMSIVPIFQNIGFYTCTVLLGAYIAIVRKRRELVGVFIVLSCLFFTTILGPVNGEFRYLYLFVVATPFILAAISSTVIPKERINYNGQKITN